MTEVIGPVPRKHGLVLLVEDNPDDERLALLGLQRADDNHEVQIVRDGEEAIDKIDHSEADEIALVLLDLKLPKVNGLQVLEHLHMKFAESCPPVVIFSSSDEPVDINRSELLGASSFVTKPVDYEEYLTTMRSIADRWLRD